MGENEMKQDGSGMSARAGKAGVAMDRRKNRRRTKALAAAVCAAVTFSAPAMSADEEIIYIGGSTAEAFWQRVAKGFDQACADLALKCTYRAPGAKGFETANEAKAFVENATAANPDGLIVVNHRPEAVNEALKAAVDSGIPLILANSGGGEQQKVGALTFVGLDEYQNGFTGGEQLKATGVQHALVVTLLPGIPIVDQRTQGFIDGFKPGKVTTLAVPNEVLYDTTKLVNALSAAFQKDESIDSAFSIGSCCSPALIVARDQLGERGEKMRIGTIDLGEPVLKALIDGKMEFALDQQQYMQGYLPVVLMAMYLRYGITPATDFIPSGPSVISAKNAELIIKLSAESIR